MQVLFNHDSTQDKNRLKRSTFLLLCTCVALSFQWCHCEIPRLQEHVTCRSNCAIFCRFFKCLVNRKTLACRLASHSVKRWYVFKLTECFCSMVDADWEAARVIFVVTCETTVEGRWFGQRRVVTVERICSLSTLGVWFRRPGIYSWCVM